MPNISGQAYGLTVLSPINNDPNRNPSHTDEIRQTLASFETGGNSPLAKVSLTHLARITVIDDVFHEGYPSEEDHLKSKYLFFSTNFDGSLDAYLDLLLDKIPNEVDQLWSHCVNFPGVADRERFHDYIKKCQLENGIFFADYGERTVSEVLAALHLKREFAKFVASHQGKPPALLKEEFGRFLKNIGNPPAPGCF
jgi:hypothetical protein